MADLAARLSPPRTWTLTLPAEARGSLLGPPLPSWWPRPGKRIPLDTPGRRAAIEPWHKVSLGPRKLVLQIATRWG